MEGKANVRIDSLIQLLIGLTVETEKERVIMIKYAAQKELIVMRGAGKWQVADNSNLYNIQEQYCPCNVQNDIAPTSSWDPSSIAIVDEDTHEEELLDVVTVENDVEEVPDTARRRFTDNPDVIRDMIQKIEMDYAAGRTRMLSVLNNPTDAALEKLAQTLRCMDEFSESQRHWSQEQARKTSAWHGVQMCPSSDVHKVSHQ
ncbi:unnamed protein product [Strongylus vulgaris]|uniref:Uncharacterized protein n=1 Tax=Strongylus vulgaris TaxID=40348 RepID=A0A3P7KS66_STRVU|nr:unnamed protein product [Strongylus vulgaris]